MAKLQIFFLMFSMISLNSFGQYCSAVGPSQTNWSNIESASLVGDASNISYTGCPGVTGLEDLTGSHTVALSANGSYTLDVLFGACNNDYWASAGEAWIDFNGNEVFEPGESLGTWQGTPPVPVTNFNFTVPSNCATGTVRLRITHQESVSPPLDPCASFTWGSTVDFSVELSGGSGPVLVNYCESVGPSSNGDSNLSQLLLTGEAGTSINFSGCPGVIGLDNQTANHSVDIAPGNNYDAFITFGTCGGIYDSAGEAWIDYNMNGIFEPSESIGQWDGTPVFEATFNFTVPLGLTYGQTRMRVVQHEGGTTPLDPCANFTWGSTTDFTVNIGDAIDCSGFTGDDMNDPRMVAAIPFQEDHSNLVCYSNNVPVYNSPDVFYRIIPSELGINYFNVSLCGSLFDTYLQVQNANGEIIASNDDYSFCGSQSELSFYAGENDTLYVVVQGWNNEKGDYSIAINDANLVGITETNSQLSIFPNPAKNQIFIQSEDKVNQVQILDMNGRIVFQGPLNNHASIDISELSRGVYMLLVETEKGLSTHKIIVEDE